MRTLCRGGPARSVGNGGIGASLVQQETLLAVLDYCWEIAGIGVVGVVVMLVHHVFDGNK
jgi:hypothetical protein